MRKYLFLLFIFMAETVLGFEVNGIYYAVNPKSPSEVYVCRSTEYHGDIVIPSTVDYGGKSYNVTSIEKLAFFGTSIRTLTLPDTPILISSCAFEDCKQLLYVDFGHGAHIIGGGAFSKAGIITLRKMDKVKYIYDKAFAYCRHIKSVVISANTEYVGFQAFMSCTKLQSVDLEDSNGPLQISSQIFSYCPLNQVYIGRKCIVKTEFSSSYYENIFKDVSSEIEILLIGNARNFEKKDLRGNWGGLKEIHLLRSTPPNIDAVRPHFILGVSTDCTLYVPKGAVSTYETSPYWEDYYNIKEAKTSELRKKHDSFGLVMWYWEEFYGEHH